MVKSAITHLKWQIMIWKLLVLEHSIFSISLNFVYFLRLYLFSLKCIGEQQSTYIVCDF